jgi:hypothetical protein
LIEGRKADGSEKGLRYKSQPLICAVLSRGLASTHFSLRGTFL